MKAIMGDIGAAIQEKMHRIPAEKFLVMVDAGEHGMKEAII